MVKNTIAFGVTAITSTVWNGVVLQPGMDLLLTLLNGNTTMSNQLEWWGYKHTSGTYIPKRYFGQTDIDEAHESPFCDIVVGPFMAKDWEDALEKVKQLIDEHN